ncbi:MAG TPA: HD domain-containing protein [Gammaproteobacteria bacterium]
MMGRLDEAIEFGRAAHAGQRRKYTGEPYFDAHCLAVAGKVLSTGGTEDMVIAALLHDTIEDTGTTYDDIRSVFGESVADMVLEVTDVFTKANYPDMNREARKTNEAIRLGKISESAQLIKRCDVEHNTSSILQHDPEFAAVYLEEKRFLLTQIG